MLLACLPACLGGRVARTDVTRTAQVEAIESGKYEFIMNNFAPPDMVGHTGMYEPAIVGVAETDRVIG